MLRISDGCSLRAANSRFSIAFSLLLLSCPFALQAQECHPWTMDDTYNAGCEACGGWAWEQTWVCNHYPCAPETPHPNMFCDICLRSVESSYQACVAALGPEPPLSPPPPTSQNQPYLACGVPTLGVRRAVAQAGAGSCGGVTFLDPVPDLQNGNNITTNHLTLGRQGRIIGAVAADSAARVVLRIQARTDGQPFTVTLRDENGDPGTKEQLGTLFSIGGSENDLHVNVTAVGDTGGNPMAFAIYRPPADFSPGGTADDADKRSVSFRVQAGDDDSYNLTGSLNLLRPPVVLVHGLWANKSAWDKFSPANTDPFVNDSLRDYFVRRAEYALPITLDPPQANDNNLLASYPWLLRKVWPLKMNSLGFAINAPNVLAEIHGFIEEFRTTHQAAAVQADVIAHSMGGLVTRTLIKLPAFTEFRTFGKGNIHKLITIGTPHQGSPLADALGNLYDNTCTRKGMALKGNVAIDTARLGGQPVNGAILDLQRNSQALGDIQNGNTRVPTAMIAGKMSSYNLNGFDTSLAPTLARATCSNDYLGTYDSLPTYMHSASWPLLMGFESDGIVPVSSQFNGANNAPDGTSAVDGIVHSEGAVALGLNGPTELDPGAVVGGVQALVFSLLNAPVAGNMFQMLP